MRQAPFQGPSEPWGWGPEGCPGGQGSGDLGRASHSGDWLRDRKGVSGRTGDPAGPHRVNAGSGPCAGAVLRPWPTLAVCHPTPAHPSPAVRAPRRHAHLTPSLGLHGCPPPRLLSHGMACIPQSVPLLGLGVSAAPVASFQTQFFKSLFIFNWRTIALQCCAGFCHTQT